MQSNTIINFVRTEIKRILHLLPESNQKKFIRLFSHQNLDLALDEVVDKIPVDKLESTLTLCEKSMEKHLKG